MIESWIAGRHVLGCMHDACGPNARARDRSLKSDMAVQHFDDYSCVV
jgi:hypothetical protein